MATVRVDSFKVFIFRNCFAFYYIVVSAFCLKSFGFFEVIFGIFLFRIFENSPLLPANPQKKSARKSLSNNLEIKLKQFLTKIAKKTELRIFVLLFADTAADVAFFAFIPSLGGVGSPKKTQCG